MKTILITGVAGFIGSHLSEKLLDIGFKIIGIDNFDPFYDKSFKEKNLEISQRSKNFDFFEGDITSRLFLDSIEDNIDVVIHLAAKAGVRPSIENPQGYLETNINGTLNILEFIKDRGIKYNIMASSSSVYGNNKSLPFSEKDNVDHAISPYAATKKACEVLCHTYKHLYNVNTAMLRFFTVYGPRQRPDLAIYKFTKLISEGTTIQMFGDGSSQRDYTFIDDIVIGIVNILDWITEPSIETKYEIFNLGESDTTSLVDLISLIERSVGRKANIEKKEMQPGDVEKTFADISKAKKLVGYNPKTLIEDGIPKFVEWFNCK